MSRRRGTGALVASPVLVGAVTVLIAIIAVFIAYNANAGLPFVPTYDLKVELPSGGKLVKGNEVRVGGFRVGVVDDLKPKLVKENGKDKAVAVASLKLDKTVEPLARDTRFRIRPRSVLGLKYVEATPGRSKQTYTAGDTVPLKQSSQPLDLEDLFSTFDPKTRVNSRNALTGFGDAFAGRGASLNTAIEALNPFFTHLTPVMRNLADPDTQLDQFFLQIGRASAQVAPVAHVQAVLFTNMADTFAAIGRDPKALQQTIEKSPPTIDTSIRSFRVQRPFYADFADLSRRLRPAVQELPRSLPAINSAFKVGTPILPRTVALNDRLKAVFDQADHLFQNPNTLLALKDLSTAVTVSRPAIEFIAPYETVCSYFNYFINGLGEAQSQVQHGPTGGGTNLNQNVKLVNTQQPNHLQTIESSRNWDLRPHQRPQGATDSNGRTIGRLYSPPYSVAIDAQGNADCELGQKGYPNGKLSTGARYGPGAFGPPPNTGFPEGTPNGGNGPITDDNLPVLVGGTYISRRLNIKNLKDVP
jgi:virulence factor Mce-like protein